MKCPGCNVQVELDRDFCSQCGLPIAYLRDHIYVGRQFAFFDATPDRPMVVDLVRAGQGDGPAQRGESDEDQTTSSAGDTVEYRLTTPTIVSRHEHDLKLGAYSLSQSTTRRRRVSAEVELPEVLPAAAVPALDLVTVVTDRRIYRPEDQVRIVAIGLNCPGQEVELEIKVSGQRIYQGRVILNDAGLHVMPYEGLEEGEYEVVLRLPRRPDVQATCSFSCAEFTLSPLIAILQSHRIDGDKVSVELRVTQLKTPYDGSAEVTLRSGQQDVMRKTAQVANGVLTTQLNLARPWQAQQALTLELVTPQGNTAMVALPGTSAEEREHITLSPLDPPVEASLAPFAGAEGSIRGLYYAHARLQDTPFDLPEVIARRGYVRALRNASLVQILLFDPLGRSHRRLEYRDVAAGAELSFDVDSPYSLFTLGAFMGRGEPYEAWGVVIQPSGLEASLEAPETAVPGQVLVAEVRSDQPAHCLLLVYDVRLEHESPLPKLARRIFSQVRDATGRLAAQRLAPLNRSDLEQVLAWNQLYGDLQWRSLESGRVRSMVSEGPRLARKGAPLDLAVEEAAPEMVLSMMVAPRESFPELAFIELLAVDRRAERTVTLGDQIGTWRCRAYLFHGHDVLELTQDIQVDAPAYAELDLPAILGKGDVVTATAHYHTQEPGRLVVTTPGGEFAQDVAGDGVMEFSLTEPGDVMTQLVAGDASDTSRRTVDPPGVETVTASRIMLLQAGQHVTGRRVLVYPSLGPLLQTSIDYLVHYPFG